MEFDLNDKGDIGKTFSHSPESIISSSEQLLLSILTCSKCPAFKCYARIETLSSFCFFRHDGVKTNVGKTWIGQDSLRAEKDDVRSGWGRIERHYQLL